MRKFLAAVGVCALLAGCGGSSSGDAAVTRITTVEKTVTTTVPADQAPAGGGAGELPSETVATVGGDPITKAEYDPWFGITARSEPATAAEVVVPDPPAYVECITALKEQARGRETPEAELRAKCRASEKRLRQATMRLLIQALWFEKEAEALGVVLSDAEVEQALRESKRESFQNEQEYERFLRQTGMTNDDVLAQVRTRELATAITDHVQRGAGKDKQKRLTEFGREFQQHWTERTQCRPGFVIRPFCGGVAVPPRQP